MNTKQAYEEKLKAQLDEWNARIELLKAKAENKKADSRVKYNETIEKLQAKKSLADDRLQELERASDDAWRDLKGGVESAWDELGSAVKSAWERYK